MSISAGLYRSSFCVNHTTVEAYLLGAYPHLYLITDYNMGYLPMFVEFMNKYFAFMWSFLDILIVSISVCLSTRFNQFNVNLLKYKGMVSGETAREIFNRYICFLCAGNAI